MSVARISLALVFPLVLLACGEEEPSDDPIEGEPAPVTETTPIGAGAVPAAPVEPPVGGTAVDAGMGQGAHVTLVPVGESGAGGMAMIDPAAAGARVMVQLTGAPAGVHAGHIHRGTCEKIGAVVTPLPEIRVATAGETAVATTTVDVPPATLFDGQHIVVYHEAGGSPGTPIVCGAIPARDAAV